MGPGRVEGGGRIKKHFCVCSYAMEGRGDFKVAENCTIGLSALSA